MDTLFWFRNTIQLEAAIAIDPPYFDEASYAMCSFSTQEQAVLYISYIYRNCCNVD